MSDSNVGGRQKRNIRDHLFIMFGIVNDVISGKGDDTDIQMFDLSKCFDSMWLKETLNDVYDAGIRNDYLALLYEENKKSYVAIKSPMGISDRKEIDEVVMQGGIFGSLECSLQIDLLGKEYSENGEHIYNYTNCLNIPPLGFVDDIAGPSKCGHDSLELNLKCEEFMKSKKLSLNEKKCYNLHIGKKDHDVNLLINGSPVEQVDSEKYLGQYLSSNGKNDKNIEYICNKGTSMSSQVNAILSEVSLGRHYFQMGLLLRDTNIINSMLFSAESWYGVSKVQVEKIQDVDIAFLKKILKSHSKTAKEAFYLETGKIPPKFLLIQRRLMFLKHILDIDQSRLLSKFYYTQKSFPVKNDWITQVEKDKHDINLNLSDVQLKSLSKNKFKKMLKFYVSNAALKYLNTIADEHSKSIPLKKKKIKCSEYLKDKRFSKSEVRLLFQLRTRMFPVKINFRNQYKLDLSCRLCAISVCDQEHLLACPVLKKFVPESNQTKVQYQDLFGNIGRQLKFIKLYKKLAEQREILLESLENK